MPMEVTLDGTDATGAHVPALPQRLGHILAAAMAELGEFGKMCGDFHQGAARACNGAFQPCYEHPWSAKSHALAKLFLPRPVGNLFGDDRVSNGYDLVDQAAMQALAVRGESALTGSLAPPGGQIPLAVFPLQALLPTLLDASLFIVVVRVVGPALSLHLALEPPDRLGIGCQFGTEQIQAWGALTGHDGNGRGSQVQANGVI